MSLLTKGMTQLYTCCIMRRQQLDEATTRGHATSHAHHQRVPWYMCNTMYFQVYQCTQCHVAMPIRRDRAITAQDAPAETMRFRSVCK